MLFRPFKVGDLVEADGTSGVVEKIQGLGTKMKTGDDWPALFALQEGLKLRFDAEGISIPFPQCNLHIINEAAA